MPSNIAQLFLKNYGNVDLFSFADPDALKTYVINDNNFMKEFKVTNGGQKQIGITAKVPDNSPLPINLAAIKNKSSRLYNALVAGDDLGAALFSKGSETINYSSVDLEDGVQRKASPAEFSDANLKFFK